ncbi:MAG: DUF364 domain-containing protein [Abditibacteriales bacterium]|nr:DUF364 domain-containing protein [Abditibacteriales bacterium]MDW8365804.1 DUF364 domain-containing protein [Abditibacteriales bacterium]
MATEIRRYFCRFVGREVEAVTASPSWTVGGEEIIACLGLDTECYDYDCRFCHDTLGDGLTEMHVALTPLVEEVKDYLYRSPHLDLDRLSVIDVRIGLFLTGVRLNTGHGGVAFTPRAEVPPAVCCPTSAARQPQAGRLLERSIYEFMGLSSHANPLLRAVGIATLNALAQLTMEREGESGRRVVRHQDAFELLNIQPSDKVGMVDAFAPYLKRLKGTVRALHLFKRDHSVLKEEEQPFLRRLEESPVLLPHCDVVIISGATLVTATLDYLLSLATNAREVAVVGPTASLIPEPFFARGVTVLGGMHITDADRMLRVVSEGGSGNFLFQECAERVNFIRGSRSSLVKTSLGKGD